MRRVVGGLAWRGRQFYHSRLKRRLPENLQRQLSRILEPLLIWRVKPGATRILGPQYRRSRRRIELNITYACNMKCYNCNRSCEQAPTGMHMTLAQIRHFIKESLAARTRWERIKIIGGEPTIHQHFLEIVNLVRDYRNLHSPHTIIEVFTNGHGEKVKRVISQIPPDIVVINGKKDGQVQPGFISFNVAPGDLDEYSDADFRNGCWVTEICGIGLGPTGYYPCGIATGMDRIFGWGIGRKSLPAEDDSMEDLLDGFCRNCGRFKRRAETPLGGPLVSPTWERTYAEYRRQPPRLPLYGESDSTTAQ